MWKLSAPWWEFIVRGAIIYFFLLVLLLILSNGVQNAMNAGDRSVLAGLILATTLILLNHAVGYVTYRSRKLETMVKAGPRYSSATAASFRKSWNSSISAIWN